MRADIHVLCTFNIRSWLLILSLILSLLSLPLNLSDVANIRTTAELDPSGKFFLVSGEKKYITSGLKADFFTVAVRTGGEGMFGISLLLMERYGTVPNANTNGPRKKRASGKEGKEGGRRGKKEERVWSGCRGVCKGDVSLFFFFAHLLACVRACVYACTCTCTCLLACLPVSLRACVPACVSRVCCVQLHAGHQHQADQNAGRVVLAPRVYHL